MNSARFGIPPHPLRVQRVEPTSTRSNTLAATSWVCGTDNRTAIFSKLPVAPRDRTPWTVSVTASIYREPTTLGGKQPAKKATKDNEKPTDSGKKKAFDGEMDPRLKYLPEIMQWSTVEQQNTTGGFLSPRPRSATLTVDLKNAFRTLEGRQKVYLWFDWEKPEAVVIRTVQTFEGRKDVSQMEYEKLHDPLKGYLEHDCPLADMLVEQGPRAKVNIRALWQALRLAKGPKGRDVNDRTKSCTYFQDGYAMATDSSRRGNAVVLVVKGPRLPFGVTVPRATRKRLQSGSGWCPRISARRSRKLKSLI